MTDGEEQEGPAAATVLRCAGIQVEAATRELTIDGVAVTIERRAFDLLVYLMRHADRVVDKDELLREVWHGRPVSESTVAQAASRVRKALGGAPDEWVATVYGVGYRFTGTVETIEARSASTPAASSNSSQGSARARPIRWRRAVGVAVLVAALIALLAVSWTRLQVPENESLRIAVLPVQNRTGDAQLDWVELGVLPLFDRALEQGGVERVQTSQVLSTLRRYPEADDPAAQARVLKLNTRAERVLVPQLTLVDGGYRLSMRSADEATDRYDLDLQGADVAVLAVAAGTTLSESLSRWQGSERARRGLVTDDPFVNEAFARGLDARLRGRWQEAARFFDTVLAAAPDLLDAKYHLALVTRRLGDWEYTEQLHAELLEAARAQGEIGMLAAVQSVSGTLAWRRGDKEAAERWYRQALDNYTRQGNADYIANTTANLGILAATRGEFAAAEARMAEALLHYRSSGDRFNEATTLKNIGNLQVDQGHYDDAEATLLESLEIRQDLELPLEVALTLSVLGDVEMARGQWDQALAYQQRVLETAREYDSPTLEIQALADLSAVLRRLGRLEEAVTLAAEAHTRATELGSPTNQGYALLQQARAELDRGRTSQAAGLFERSADVYDDIDQPLDEGAARIGRIAALVEAGRLEDAATELIRVRELVDGPGRLGHEVELARVEARLALAAGEAERARSLLEGAFEKARESQVPIEVADTGGVLGLVLLDQGAANDRIAGLADELGRLADASAAALEFLVRFYAPTEPARALALAERRRALVGEGWTPDDQRVIETLQASVGDGEGA